MIPDRIEKKVQLRSSLEQVWHAVSNAEQFGRWFGVKFDGPFMAGARLKGRIAPTQVDPEIAKLQKPYEGTVFEFEVDRIEPMKRISFRWHPFAIDPKFDYSKEPMTLIVFELEEVPDGVLLTISESGFEKIPLERRAQAFTANDGGWTKQTELIQKYVATGVAA